LTKPPTIVRDNDTLQELLPTLGSRDIVCGRVRLRPGEEYILFDLTDRGVTFIPSARSQLASRSKTYQARIFNKYMVPGTLCVYDRHDLLHATTFFNHHKSSAVILKKDNKNAGLGVNRFASIEELYNQVSGGGYSFPFIIQPFYENYVDLRVIILDDYHEAYRRFNPHNFRQNMHCGGTSSPQQISEIELNFCRTVMDAGKFPYAHVDLMLTENGNIYLQEINLRGGLRGARISPEDYRNKLEKIHEKQLELACVPTTARPSTLSSGTT